MGVIDFDDFLDSEAEVCPDCELRDIRFDEMVETGKAKLQEQAEEIRQLKSRLAGKPIATPDAKDESTWEYCPECEVKQVGLIYGTNKFHDMCKDCREMNVEVTTELYEKVRESVRDNLRIKAQSRDAYKRKREAVTLLQEGKTHPEIAELLGVSERQAYRDTKDILAE